MKSLFSVFKKGLEKTTTTVSRSLAEIFIGEKKWDKNTFEGLEAILIAADFGVPASLKIVEDIRDRYKRGHIKTSADIFETARNEVINIFSQNRREVNYAPAGKPTVILMIGVNGSGKTTTAGKLAWLWQQEGKKVILAACDTFRAAAVGQLKLWGEKTGCYVVSAAPGADPASVAFDATRAALARGADILIIDTAGRQHTKKNLMDELSKLRRTIDKAYPGAPQETWLTVDASLGANAINQAREFSKAAGLTGLILTKLDGTGKGGMAVALHQEFGYPVFFAGLGEKPEDLQPFDPEFYAAAIFESAGK
jgi:fused signal recognition particle receptor